MRKLLMAGVAILGASLGMANAAQVYNSDPTKPVTDSASSGSAGTLALAPGQMTIRIDLRENVYVTGAWGSADSVDGNKQAPLAIYGYPRLYMAFDAMATNGLKYGLLWEIRDNAGANNASSSGAPGANSGGQTMFWRQDFGYIGMPTIGTLRIGQTYGTETLFEIGTFDDVATGLWDGDINDAGIGGGGFSGVVPWWPFPDSGNIYTTTKAVYLSPSFAGFDFGVGYEPNTSALNDGPNCTIAAGGPVGCANQSSSSSSGDLQRRRNTLDAAIRYRGSFGPVGVAGSLITLQGGHINPTQGATASTPGGPSVSHFDNVSIYDAGLTGTVAGLTVGGNVIWGQYNGQFAPKPDGGANSVAWVAGAKYTYGPVTMGGQYFSWTYQGALGLPTQRHDQGFAAGLTYNISPGIAFLAEYLYGMRHQGDYDFVQNIVAPTNNNVKVQIVGAGFQWRW